MNISERLYRAQSNDYHDCPLAPSAMRFNNISLLRNNTEYAQLTSAYSDFNIEATTKWYKDIRCTKDMNPFEDYFLSLVNLCIHIKRNPLLRKFCKAPFFIDSINNAGTLNCDDATTIARCYYYAKAIFKHPEKEKAYAFYHDLIKIEMSYFQHLNHIFRKLGKDCPFPTMMLDWTEDIATAKKFASNESREIFSINKKKCFDFFRSEFLMVKLDESKPRQPQIDEALRIYESGKRENTLPENIEYIIYGLYHYKAKDCKNQLMIDQYGVTIFWPWSFTPEELIDQQKKGKGLGYEIDFRQEVENYTCHHKPVCGFQ
jgi:hypothetical protein